MMVNVWAHYCMFMVFWEKKNMLDGLQNEKKKKKKKNNLSLMLWCVCGWSGVTSVVVW